MDDPVWGEAVDFDQEIGRLVSEGGNVVEIRGERIAFPKTWLKPVAHG